MGAGTGSFNIDGLASGLDTANIISQLMQIEKVPLLRLQETKAEYNVQLPLLQELNTLMLGLKNSSSDLKIESDFFKKVAESSNESAASITTEQDAEVGNYTLNEIRSVATSSVATSNIYVGGSVNSADLLKDVNLREAITSGSFTINGESFTVDADTESLDDMINKINAESGITGVTASYDSSRDAFSLQNVNPTDTSIIALGDTDDSSNFLSSTGVLGAYQETGSGSTRVFSNSHLGALDKTDILQDASLGLALTSGTFKINGTEITVNAASDTLESLIEKINTSKANVTATYDEFSDKLSIKNNETGSTLVGLVAGTSNVLDVFNVESSTTALKEMSVNPKLSDNTRLYDLNTTFSQELPTTSPAVNMKFEINGISPLWINKDVPFSQFYIDQYFNNPLAAAGSDVRASYDDNGIFSLYNSTPGNTAPITVTDTDGNFFEMMKLDGAVGDTSSGETVLSSTGVISGIRTSDDFDTANFATPIIDGKIQIHHEGVTKEFSYGAGMSIDSFLNEINNTDGLKFSAYYDDATDHLILEPESGSSSHFSITEIGSGNFLDVTGNSTGNPQIAGEDAEYVLNGLTYYSNTNVISDKIDGVEFTLKEATSSATTLSVAANSDAAKENITGFVEDYNIALSKINELYSDTEGALYRDSTLRDMMSSLKSLANSFIRGNDSSFQSLSSIGIGTGDVGMVFTDDYFGELQIDEDALTSALNSDAKGVMKLFFYDPNGGTDFNTGIGQSFLDILAPLTNPTGTLMSKQNLLTSSIEKIGSQIINLEASLELKETNLRRTYTSLEIAMGQLNREADYVSSQLSQLGSFSSS